MTRVRIAVASTPLTATLDEAVPAAVAAVEEAGRQGAAIVCLPETDLPGHRMQQRAVQDVTIEEVDRALDEVAAAAARAGVVTIAGVERPCPAGREIVAVVLGVDGVRLGEQVKTQIDPDEEPFYVPGSGRRLFRAAGVTFAVAICHEAFRYPELVRWAAREGAEVVFAPHFVTTDDGTPQQRWCDPAGSYHEKALMCRALENTVYVAASNAAGPAQGSASCIIDPDGRLVVQVPYGQVGVAAADLDLSLAHGLLARRYAPERNAVRS